MSARAVRAVVLVVCALGIAGVIGGSAADNTGLALTAGVITVVAVLCLIVGTAVERSQRHQAAEEVDVETQAQRVEEAVRQLVAEGVAEQRVRDLVREAVRLGRAR